MIAIDIESIMEEIRSNICNRGYVENGISFQDMNGFYENKNDNIFELQDLQNYIYETNVNCNVQINHELNYQGIKGKIIIFIKKIIRKLIQFYIVPIVEEQQKFNSSVTRSLNQVNGFIKIQQENDKKIDNLDYEFNKNIKKEIDISNKNYCNVLKENSELKKMLNKLLQKKEESDNRLKVLSHKLEIAELKLNKLELMLEEKKEV